MNGMPSRSHSRRCYRCRIYWCFERSGKAPKSRRSVALSPVAVEALQDHSTERESVCGSLGTAISGDDLVFGDVHGAPLSPSTVSHAFGDICKKAGISGIRFHDLRHTHATLLMKQGTSPKVVQERLGHSSISVTLDIYSHVVPGMQELAALQFDDGLKSLGADRAALNIRTIYRDF